MGEDNKVNKSLLSAVKKFFSGGRTYGLDGTANELSEEYAKKIQKAAAQKTLDDENAINAYALNWLKEKILKTTKESNDEAGMNKGGIPKKNFAKPGSYSSAYNKGGMTMRKGNMAYNKGGMGKSKTGHSDYRKGGMVYTTKGKK